MKLFNLLNLYIKDEKEFDKETKLIINNKYNIHLIEGNEKIRINQYIQLFAHYEVYLNEKQKKFIANFKYKISEKDKLKINALENKYNIAKKGIELFKDILPRMERFFNEIKLEENNFNIKIFTFLLYVTDIIQRISPSGIEPAIIENFFEKEIAPTKDIEENNSLNNLIKLESKFKFPENYGIKKMYDNNLIDKKDKERKKKMNEYIIFNKFETVEFDGKNYVIDNLINDFKNNAYFPLKVLLSRNQSLSYFVENKSNFLNAKNIISKFLDDKYLKSIPLFDFAGSGYTNKDLLVSFISGLPFLIYRYDVPKTLEEYENLKGVVFLFNVGMKTITTLHELIIHLCFG